MPTILGVDIAGIIGDAMGPLLLDATLTKYTAGTRTAGDLAAGTAPTSTAYAAKGVIADYQAYRIDGTIIQRGDRQVTLLGATIDSDAVPAVGDTVTIESTTWTIVAVSRDPAAASYALQVRG